MTNETIGKILNELKRVEYILVNIHETGKVSDIERDIIKAKLRTMYEFIQFIQLENFDFEKQSTSTQAKPQKDFPTPTKVVLAEKVEEVFEPLAENIDLILDKQTDDSKPIEPLIETEKPIEPVKQEKKPEVKPKAEILGETFEMKGFLHETLLQYQNSHNLSKKYQLTPLKDIFSAISLNDRFLFIKGLFNSETVVYQNTIETLNSSGSFNEAVQYLDNQFKWDFNEPMVQKLLDLIHRRYLPNE